jgi:hypothetical protein
VNAWMDFSIIKVAQLNVLNAIIHAKNAKINPKYAQNAILIEF